MISRLEKCLSFVILLLVAFLSIGCQDNNINVNGGEGQKENIVNREIHSIMEGTTLETEVYVFTSSLEGPTIFIIGGTHGDEVAGWKAAERLITKEYYENYIGKVIIIPHANNLGDLLQQRYPGISNNGMYDGVQYQDLNRSFPGSPDGTLTEQLAYAICQEVLKYNPKYVVDLHESRGSYSTDNDGTSRLGNQLLYANGKSMILCSDIISTYNANYLEEGDTKFSQEGPGVAGSFNAYVGTELKLYEFTIETSRKLDLEKRINQQLNILKILFDYAWNEK